MCFEKIQPRPNGTLADDAKAEQVKILSGDLQMTAIMGHLKAFSGMETPGPRPSTEKLILHPVSSLDHSQMVSHD